MKKCICRCGSKTSGLALMIPKKKREKERGSHHVYIYIYTHTIVASLSISHLPACHGKRKAGSVPRVVIWTSVICLLISRWVLGYGQSHTPSHPYFNTIKGLSVVVRNYYTSPPTKRCHMSFLHRLRPSSIPHGKYKHYMIVG